MIKKILFISHDASRAGAPLILLTILKWINTNVKGVQLDVVLLDGGLLENEFKAECKQLFIYSHVNTPLKFSEIISRKTIAKLGMQPTNKEAKFFEDVAANNYHLIYANSILSIPIAVKIKKARNFTKLIVHVHELNTILKMSLPNFTDYQSYINKYIAVSNLVKDNLVANYQVAANLIEVIHGFAVVKGGITQHANKHFTVGASGMVHWRKGYDLFIQVANYIYKNYTNANIQFNWVGNKIGHDAIVEGDLEKLNLKERVSFVGEQPNPIKLYNDFDVFVLTSREDPFPLVCIEIASLKKPIICFEKASGSAEVIKNGGGFVVPYLDVEEMGEKIMVYYFDRDKLKEDGNKAHYLFSNFTPEQICPLIYKQISTLLPT